LATLIKVECSEEDSTRIRGFEDIRVLCLGRDGFSDDRRCSQSIRLEGTMPNGIGFVGSNESIIPSHCERGRTAEDAPA